MSKVITLRISAATREWLNVRAAESGWSANTYLLGVLAHSIIELGDPLTDFNTPDFVARQVGVCSDTVLYQVLSREANMLTVKQIDTQGEYTEDVSQFRTIKRGIELVKDYADGCAARVQRPPKDAETTE